VRERRRAAPEEGPGSPAPVEPGTVVCAQRNSGSLFLSSLSRFCFPGLGHGQSGAGSIQGPVLLQTILTSHGIFPSTLVNGGIALKELGVNLKP